MKNNVLDTVNAKEVPSFMTRALQCAALLLAVTASTACAGDPGAEEAAGNIDSELQTCNTPAKDRVGNSLQQVYDALYRDDTGTGFQRVNKGSLPVRSWRRSRG